MQKFRAAPTNQTPSLSFGVFCLENTYVESKIFSKTIILISRISTVLNVP